MTAHPNPFNPRTTISLDLPRTAAVSLAVQDWQGRLVRDPLASTRYPAGSHQLAWDGRDDRGQASSSGTYFSRFAAGREELGGKLTLLN